MCQDRHHASVPPVQTAFGSQSIGGGGGICAAGPSRASMKRRSLNTRKLYRQRYLIEIFFHWLKHF